MLPIFRQIKIFSKSMILVVSIFYLFNIFLDGFIFQQLSLNPSKLLQNFEYWRLFTFPFAYSTNEAFFLFLATFFFISENLEDMLKQTLYPALLMLLTLLQGVLMTLMYWNQNINISGTEGISFFVIMFFLILSPKSKIQIFDFKPIPSVLFALSIIFVWSLVKILTLYHSGFEQVNASVASAFFGVIAGMMTSFQIKYVQKSRLKKFRKTAEELKIPKAEELSYALLAGKNYRAYEPDSNLEDYDADLHEPVLTDNPNENEEILNLILDKINEKGKEALHPSELKFLDDYSHNL